MHKRIADHAHVLNLQGVHENKLGKPAVDEPCRGIGRLFNEGWILAKLHGRFECNCDGWAFLVFQRSGNDKIQVSMTSLGHKHVAVDWVVKQATRLV